MKLSTSAIALVASGSVTHASITRTCPTANVCYSLNIPDSTAQSGNGDIYFQIQAPTSYTWVALGQGTSMPGANIFMIYSSGDNQNVTLSPRLGTGFVMPQHDTSADVTLLAGSGISDGMMTANVKCSNCNSWNGGTMDFTSASASWIYAYKSGSPLETDDPAAGVSKHDYSDSFAWNFAAAKGGSDVNPFVVSTATTPGNPSSSSTPVVVTTQAPSSGGESAEQRKNIKVRSAHAYLASTAFLLLFPLGAVLIRLGRFSNLMWVHVAVQILAFTLFTAAFGMGLYLATTYDEISKAHPIIGIVVFVCIFSQFFSGWTHHLQFVKYGRRTLGSFMHLGVGRIAIILGISNGFVGLNLADEASQSERHAYLALAVIALVTYVGSIIYGEFTRAKRLRNANASRSPSSGDDVGKQESDTAAKVKSREV